MSLSKTIWVLAATAAAMQSFVPQTETVFSRGGKSVPPNKEQAAQMRQSVGFKVSGDANGDELKVKGSWFLSLLSGFPFISPSCASVSVRPGGSDVCSISFTKWLHIIMGLTTATESRKGRKAAEFMSRGNCDD